MYKRQGQDCCGFSVSDNQFGVIRRPVRDEAMDVWEKEDWSERPDSIYPFLSYVSGCGERGLAVLTNSVREYEMIGPDYSVLAVTLFRSVGVLGKEGLLRRPGRPSGIKMETPDSQPVSYTHLECPVLEPGRHGQGGLAAFGRASGLAHQAHGR